MRSKICNNKKLEAPFHYFWLRPRSKGNCTLCFQLYFVFEPKPLKALTVNLNNFNISYYGFNQIIRYWIVYSEQYWYWCTFLFFFLAFTGMYNVLLVCIKITNLVLHLLYFVLAENYFLLALPSRNVVCLGKKYLEFRDVKVILQNSVDLF